MPYLVLWKAMAEGGGEERHEVKVEVNEDEEERGEEVREEGARDLQLAECYRIRMQHLSLGGQVQL